MNIHTSAMVHDSATLGQDTRIWALTTVRENAKIGSGTSLGIGVYVGPGVEIGQNCKIQNGAYLYEPCRVSDGAFIGPNVVFTNDKNPRAIKASGVPITTADWTAVGVIVGKGASIGASTICIAPVKIGEWALVAAGSVVTKDVPRHALVAGTPARQIGWVGLTGYKLEKYGNGFMCNDTGDYFEFNIDLGILELKETQDLSQKGD